MVKLGLIIDEHHLKEKMADFLAYIKPKAEISYYIEENYLLKKFNNIKFDEDLFFVKGRGDLMVDLAKHIEYETGKTVINSSKCFSFSI